MSWQAVSAEKRSLRSQAIAEGVAVADKNIHIDSIVSTNVYLQATASEIVENIRTKKQGWTATAVTSAFIQQAARVQEQTNCLTEVMFTQALERAAELDREFGTTGQLRGPLHGVPISLKDQLQVEGVDATIGFTRWAHKPSVLTTPLVKKIIESGGIPIVKTNVPQTMLSFECCNPLWGRTLNPHNTNNTSGGSSGGEAALLACDGSALGIGSDVGGSLRIPAHFCGIYSLKPTAGRMSLAGAMGVTPGAEAIKTTAGPMARSVDDVKLACQTLFAHEVDAFTPIPPVPYKEHHITGKLRLGYYTSDGVVKASPACQRAVLETVEAMQKQGHECIEIVPPDVTESLRTFNALVSSDGFTTLLSHLKGDPREPSLFLVTLGPSLPGFVRAFASWVIDTFVGDHIFAKLLRSARRKSVTEYWAETKNRDEYIHRFTQEVWDKHELDALIAPTLASPALPHGGAKYLAPLAVGTVLYNLVDSPAGIIPVTHVDPSKDTLTDAWWSSSGHGSKLLETRLYTGADPIYNPERMKGLPVGVQVVGRLWQDEKVLAVMKVIDEALGERGFGPGTSPLS